MGGDPEAEALLGVAYASRQCEELLAGGAPGIHFYALNRAPGTRAVLSALRASRPVGAPARAGRGRDLMRGADGTFEWKGYNLAYSDFGSGDQALVLMHGLLMNRHMFDRMAPEMASRGYRVITIDTLGHGASDRPEDMRLYNMPAFGDQIAALIDHLELDRPVVGGTSLGANAALEFGHAHAGKARALLVEMPVLDNALLGATLAFTPVLLGLRFGQPILKPLSAAPPPSAPHEPPDRHRARLAPPGPGSVPRRARGHPLSPHRTAP